MELNLDKSTWKPVTFGDVVQEARTTIKDPKGSGVERVVGLEHIETECIHLRSWASIDEATTFTKGFKKGHVLFGRRRAYLKKASLADFDGICSGDITVMEAKDGLLPELLPFLVCNDKFFDYAVKHSAGGLSPRTKFKDLANYEFLLPPKDQQAKLAELLWAADAEVEQFITVRNALQALYQSTLSEFFGYRSKWESIKLSEIADVNKKSLSAKTDTGYTFKYLDIASILAPKKIDKLREMTFGEAPSRARRKVPDRSIVISMVRPNLKSFAFIEKGDGIIASTGTAIVNVHDDYSTRLVYHQFFSDRFQHFCEGCMTGTNYPAITTSDVGAFKIHMPSTLEEQMIYANQFDQYDSAIEAVESKISSSMKLQKSLINQIF